MESSFKPLTSVEFYEGCLTSSERSCYISGSSPEASLSPSSTAWEIYQGMRTPEYWWELSPSRVDTIGAVDDDGDSNGNGHGGYPIIPFAANPTTSLISGQEHLEDHQTSMFPQSGDVTSHIFNDDGVHKEGAVYIWRLLRPNTTLVRPILLADQVAKVAADVFHYPYFKAECAELKVKTEKLASLLRQAARTDLYQRPLSRIIDKTTRALKEAFTLIIKCRAKNGIIPTAFKMTTAQLENSIGDVTWVLAFSANPRVEEIGLPPIASSDPILCMIWELIATLYTGSMETKAAAAAALVSLAENECYAKRILEESGVAPLLRLLKEDSQDGQEEAARAIGILARDTESVQQMILADVGTVFSIILEQGYSMKLQSNVAWAISELASSHPKCQDHFVQNNNIICLLVAHLIDFKTVQKHNKGRQLYEDDPATKAKMKAMASRALWKLCSGNPWICHSTITESPALFCFAVLLEEGPEQVQYNSAMALMEIAAVAEQYADLRRLAFNLTSPPVKAVVDQLLRIVEKADSDLLVIPCIKAIGSLSRTFLATETRRIIRPLVRLLHEREDKVMREAVIALTKFACKDNHLCIHHSKAVLNAGGAKHLVQLVYFGDQMVQTISLVLLCYTALHVPDSEALAQAEVLSLLEWASKQGYMAQDPHLETLLPEAKGILKLMYQSRGFS